MKKQNSELLVGLVVLYSANPSKSRLFYETLGLTFVEEQDKSGSTHYSSVIGDTVLEIYPGTQTASGSGSIMIGFGVRSLPLVLERLLKIGFAQEFPVKRAKFGRFTSVMDPDGRLIHLQEFYDD